jgi:hypothetical protein
MRLSGRNYRQFAHPLNSGICGGLTVTDFAVGIEIEGRCDLEFAGTGVVALLRLKHCREGPARFEFQLLWDS